MPELPEVEAIRRCLTPILIGQRIGRVTRHRMDVIRGRPTPANLLFEQIITSVLRHGKQLALVAETGRVVNIHLGMSGSLVLAGAGKPTPLHTHVVWRLGDGWELRFRDPRRFGGIWVFHNAETLYQQRWRALGPDALTMTPQQLQTVFQATGRGVKAVLLDQRAVAGLGNIYVDELLFASRIHPQSPARAIPAQALAGLVRRLRRILTQAAEAGGSSLRDHLNGDGRPGGFQSRHKAYGRAGLPCATCGTTLISDLIAGRTTVWCPSCQTAGR